MLAPGDRQKLLFIRGYIDKGKSNNLTAKVKDKAVF
jgi:hypothetical protein